MQLTLCPEHLFCRYRRRPKDPQLSALQRHGGCRDNIHGCNQTHYTDRHRRNKFLQCWNAVSNGFQCLPYDRPLEQHRHCADGHQQNAQSAVEHIGGAVYKPFPFPLKQSSLQALGAQVHLPADLLFSSGGRSGQAHKAFGHDPDGQRQQPQSYQGEQEHIQSVSGSPHAKGIKRPCPDAELFSYAGGIADQILHKAVQLKVAEVIHTQKCQRSQYRNDASMLELSGYQSHQIPQGTGKGHHYRPQQKQQQQ